MTTYTDKAYVKKLSNIIYYLGMGDCWYEPKKQSRRTQYLYFFYCIVGNAYIIIVTFSELAANFRTDLTNKERNDCIQFSFAHPTVYFKYVAFVGSLGKIKKFFELLLEICRVDLTTSVEKAAIRKCNFYIGMLALSMFCCAFFASVDGVRYHFSENIPVRTLVTYWPGKYDEGFLAEITRVVIQFMWWYLLSTLVALDSICISGLVLLGFRFRTLQIFFKNIGKDVLKSTNKRSRDEIELEIEKRFIDGVKLHIQTLKCARSLQDALGNMYSVQVVQSISLLAICMLKLVNVERNATFLMANMSFIFCLLTLTACYMMAGGDITHEASLVPDAMFNSGWEICKGNRLRPLLVISIQCSARPVIMTAFGIYDLSYKNYISVMRNSYSFFAVMY